MNRIILTALVSAGGLHSSLASAQGDTVRAVASSWGSVTALVLRQGGAEQTLPKVR